MAGFTYVDLRNAASDRSRRAYGVYQSAASSPSPFAKLGLILAGVVIIALFLAILIPLLVIVLVVSLAVWIAAQLKRLGRAVSGQSDDQGRKNVRVMTGPGGQRPGA